MAGDPQPGVLGADPARRAIYLAGMTPAVWYFYCGITDQLGVDPQKTLLTPTGPPIRLLEKGEVVKELLA